MFFKYPLFLYSLSETKPYRDWWTYRELGEGPNLLSNLANKPQFKATHLKFANFNLESYC